MASPAQQDAPLDLAPVHVDVDGFPVPAVFETSLSVPMKEHVQCLRSLELRHDDVILLAYPKAGTHWWWEVASMLLAGKVEYEKRVKELAMMEATPIETMQSEASPRVFNTHLPLSHLPWQQVKDKKVKIIHVYRNPKDILVSKYFHYRQMPRIETLTFEALEGFYFTENAPCSYVAYLQGVDQFRKDNPDIPFFNIAYEDAIEDPLSAVSRLSDFLGADASPELCAEVAEATSLAKLRSADKDKQQHKLPPYQIYRKGKVGDWKNYLTVALSERIDTTMTPLQSCDYRFRYTL